MNKVMRLLLQVLAYGSFAVVAGYLSASPNYEYGSSDLAVVKISLSHATERIEPCVLLTPEEIAQLAPNMRRTEQCERARLPLSIELDIDGELVLAMEAPPSGLWGDGAASVYQRFEVAPGPHQLSARLRDTAREDGWDYTLTSDVNLVAGRYLTVTFRAENGGFEFR
ncbi:MAG: hypothetical protein ACR2QT_13535 [Woeseiaceae bacterium]